jgi:hypothetical protein
MRFAESFFVLWLLLGDFMNFLKGGLTAFVGDEICRTQLREWSRP